MTHEGRPPVERSLAEEFPRIDFERVEDILSCFLHPEVFPVNLRITEEIFQDHKAATERASRRYGQMTYDIEQLVYQSAQGNEAVGPALDQLLTQPDPRERVGNEILDSAVENGLLVSAEEIDLRALAFVSAVRARDILLDGADLLKGTGMISGGSVFNGYSTDERERRIMGREEWSLLADPTLLASHLALMPQLQKLFDEGAEMYERLSPSTASPSFHVHFITRECRAIFERAHRELSKGDFAQEGTECVSERLRTEQLASYKWMWHLCLRSIHHHSANQLGLDPAQEERIQNSGGTEDMMAVTRSILGRFASDKRVRDLEHAFSQRIHEQAQIRLDRWLSGRDFFATKGQRVHPHLSLLMRYVFAGELLHQELPMAENPFLSLLDLAETGCLLLPHEKGAVAVVPTIE
jgi:hypothetical protein